MRHAVSRLRAVCIALTLLVVVSGCGSSASNGSSHATSGVLQIGFQDALSGPQQATVAAAVSGANAAVAIINRKGGVLGKNVKLVMVDDQYTASGAVAGLRQLAAQGVHVAVASTGTPACQAYLPLLQTLDMTVVTDDCTTGNLTGPDVNPRFFRVADTSPQIADALGAGMCETLPGIKNVQSISLDYITPLHITDAVANRMASKCGVSASTVVKVPLNATDLLPYVTTLLSKRPQNAASDTVLQLSLFGTPLLSFIKVATQTGLFHDYKAVITGTSGWVVAAEQLSPNVPPVYLSSDYYYTAFKNSLNDEFVREYKSKTGKPPSIIAFQGFQSVTALLAGIAKAGSADPTAVASALAGLTFQNVEGPVTIDAKTHQANGKVVLAFYNGATVTVRKVLDTCSTCAETFAF